MTKKLILALCSCYQNEAENIADKKPWENIEYVFFPEVCRYPHLRSQTEKQLQKIEDNKDTEIKIIGCYSNCITNLQHHDDPDHPKLEQCLQLLIPSSLIMHYSDLGINLICPGWVANWREHLQRWGFNQETARQMYHESVKKIVLVDSLISYKSKLHLNELGEYLDIPTESLPVGLDHMSMYLSNIVLDWQHKNQLNHINHMMSESNQISADYAMAIDLLINLTQIYNEEDAIDEVVDLYTMLFSAERVIYFPINDKKLIKRGDHSISDEDFNIVQSLFSSTELSFHEINTGFCIKLEHLNELIGILFVDQLRLPVYKQRYLNIAISIAQLCSLAISNARIYHKLEVAEEKARYERGISETFRNLLSDLVSHQNLNDVLRQTSIALTNLVKMQSGVIYLMDGSDYVFESGFITDKQYNLSIFLPKEAHNSIPYERITNFEMAEHIEENQPISSVALFPDDESKWSIFHLLIKGLKIGFLAIKAENIPKNENFNELIQMFANEVAIAIENARLFEKITEMANIDGLTEIYNRRYFYNLAKIEFARAMRYHAPLSILMLDIDYFKSINDKYGHPFGDEVLKQVAKLCKNSIRVMDIAGRYGGEEFVFALPETDQKEAIITADRIRETIANHNFQHKPDDVHVTVSIGVATIDPQSNNFEELLQKSDDALYKAKQNGRNRVEKS